MGDNATAFDAGTLSIHYNWDLIKRQAASTTIVMPPSGTSSIKEDQQHPGVARYLDDFVDTALESSGLWRHIVLSGITVGCIAFNLLKVGSMFFGTKKTVVANTITKPGALTGGAFVTGFRLAYEGVDKAWHWCTHTLGGIEYTLIPSLNQYVGKRWIAYDGAHSTIGLEVVTDVSTQVGEAFSESYYFDVDSAYGVETISHTVPNAIFDLKTIYGSGVNLAIVPYVSDDFTLNAFDIVCDQFTIRPSIMHSNAVFFSSTAGTPLERYVAVSPKDPLYDQPGTYRLPTIKRG